MLDSNVICVQKPFLPLSRLLLTWSLALSARCDSAQTSDRTSRARTPTRGSGSPAWSPWSSPARPRSSTWSWPSSAPRQCCPSQPSVLECLKWRGDLLSPLLSAQTSGTWYSSVKSEQVLLLIVTWGVPCPWDDHRSRSFRTRSLSESWWSALRRPGCSWTGGVWLETGAPPGRSAPSLHRAGRSSGRTSGDRGGASWAIPQTPTPRRCRARVGKLRTCPPLVSSPEIFRTFNLILRRHHCATAYLVMLRNGENWLEPSPKSYSPLLGSWRFQGT